MSRGESNLNPRQAIGKGRFVKWEIVEPREQEPNVLTSLGPVEVKFTVEVNEAIRKGVHGIALYNGERQLIWGWAAYNLDLPKGRHDFCYRFPMLPLRPGPYTWLVSLWEDEDQIDVWDCIPEIIVAAEPIAHPTDEWAGLLNIPTDFSISLKVELN
jgi:hypothetical protein